MNKSTQLFCLFCFFEVYAVEGVHRRLLLCGEWQCKHGSGSSVSLVLGAVEGQVGHVPVAAAFELLDVLRLARRHVVVVVAEPVVC